LLAFGVPTQAILPVGGNGGKRPRALAGA